jgi:hypothetical protein
MWRGPPGLPSRDFRRTRFGLLYSSMPLIAAHPEEAPARLPTLR